MAKALYEKYLRVNRLAHIWCPGCGIGQIINGTIRAIDKVGWDQDKTVIVSGIGCSGRAPGYMNFDTIHTMHGRALAFATGMKLARPELNVLVIMGDGDCAAIGGNHFIHAARRNIDVKALVINNQIYGMTGGQYSPTTPVDAMATTAPYGDAEPGFDLCGVARAAGATDRKIRRSDGFVIARTPAPRRPWILSMISVSFISTSRLRVFRGA